MGSVFCFSGLAMQIVLGPTSFFLPHAPKFRRLLHLGMIPCLRNFAMFRAVVYNLRPFCFARGEETRNSIKALSYARGGLVGF